MADPSPRPDAAGRLRAALSSHRRSLVIAGVLGAVALWWWWPTVARSPERTDVLVVADGQVAEARDPLERRLRERGLSVVWQDATGSWCDAAALAATAAEQLEPGVVVLSVRDDTSSCARLDELGAAELPEVVLVVQPGPPGLGQPAELQDRLRSGDHGIVADPTPLLGPDGAATMPCQWWDDCAGDGLVVVRDRTGALTAAGGERVARVVAAVVP